MHTAKISKPRDTASLDHTLLWWKHSSNLYCEKITPRIKVKAPHKRPKTVTSSSSINLCTISIICCITDSFYDHPIRGKPIFHRMYYIVRNNHEEGCISPLQRPHYFTSSYTHNNFEKSDYCIVLQKINCTRQFESKLSLRSFALSFRVKDC